MEWWVGCCETSTVRTCYSWGWFPSVTSKTRSVLIYKYPISRRFCRCNKLIRWSLQEAHPMGCLPEGGHVRRRTQRHDRVLTGLVYRIPLKQRFVHPVSQNSKLVSDARELKRARFPSWVRETFYYHREGIIRRQTPFKYYWSNLCQRLYWPRDKQALNPSVPSTGVVPIRFIFGYALFCFRWQREETFLGAQCNVRQRVVSTADLGAHRSRHHGT